MMGAEHTSRSSPSPPAHARRVFVDLAKSALSLRILEKGDQNSDGWCNGMDVRFQDDPRGCDNLLEGS